MFELKIKIQSKELDAVLPMLESTIEGVKRLKSIGESMSPFFNMNGLVFETIKEMDGNVIKDLVASVESESELNKIIKDFRGKYGFDIESTVKKIKSGEELTKGDMIFEQVTCQSFVTLREEKYENEVIMRHSYEDDDDDWDDEVN